MEPTSMLLRSMTAVTNGLAAGLVLGAKVPIVLPTRIESMEVRMASCVLAMLYANRHTLHAGAPDAQAPHKAPHSTRADSVAAS